MNWLASLLMALGMMGCDGCQPNGGWRHLPPERGKPPGVEPLNRLCPICRKPVNPSCGTVWRGKKVAFRCVRCLLQWEEDLSKEEKFHRLTVVLLMQ